MATHPAPPGNRGFQGQRGRWRDDGDQITSDDESEATTRLYLVQHGRAVFELDGERLDAPAGTLVFVRPGTKRTVFAKEPGTTIIVVGSAVNKAYQPDGWEIWAHS